MKNAALIVAVFALPLILAAFAVGWALSGSGPGRPGATAPPPQAPVASTTPAEEPVPSAVPEADVPGSDPDGLPRYPGSTRVAYRHEKLDGLARTSAEYASDADPDEIRAFYRGVFHSRGWTVADLDFSPEEWYFFVVRDEREALVQIQALRSPVVVEIELTGPDGEAAPPQPARPAPATQQHVVDDDGDDPEGADDYYEDD
ncbi:hypothetical protein GBA65_20270 [Rubrobacter marinus]|uniref:Secreted protein n=1 Tax=Rubrobacter marinus TaxID=2653852 RepID=A0A6G8Q1U9_9ACTN|nr:hypothetical protein [Rubrobacter marinus]QIN80464.1 hypothetical protein GBA65_20270 [Rubrobacter marinus]